MKISIIGAGTVGSSIAYSVLGMSEELELVDIDIKKAKAEALDLQDAAKISNYNTVISWSGEPGKADIYIISAGKRRKDGDNRNDLLIFNRKVVEDSCKKIIFHNTDPWIIMVTNPSGELATETLRYFRKVISCGRDLDQARIKVTGPHEDMQIFNHNSDIRKGKGYTNWGISAEVRGLVGEILWGLKYIMTSKS